MNNAETVLIVEDERPLREALRKKITGAGYSVLVADNGQEGLALALERRPDIILLDQLMPVMDGITMLGKLRQDKRGQSIPVIILTNVDPNNEKTNEAVTKLEPSYYLVKSDWTLEAVLEKIQELIASPLSDQNG